MPVMKGWEGGRGLISQLRKKALMPICKDGGTKELQITEDMTGVSWLIGVSDFAKLIVGVQEDLFECRERGRGVTVVIKYSNRVAADWFVSLVKCAPRYVKKTFPYHSFEPEVDLFFQMLSGNNEVKEFVELLGCEFSPILALEFCNALNGFFRQYRDAISSKEFKSIVNRRKRAARKNDQTLSNLVADLFDFRSRLLVVRVDLYYPSDYAGSDMSGTTVTPDMVAKHRADFVRRVERSFISEHLLDFVWKLEFTERKGFHYHWFFFFDGAKVRQGITLGRSLGNLWKQVIGSSGAYWNCNAQQHRYENAGIGMICRGDERLRNGLSRACNYLTKPDYYLALSKQKVGDTFGTWPKGRKIRGRKVKRQMLVMSDSVCGVA